LTKITRLADAPKQHILAPKHIKLAPLIKDQNPEEFDGAPEGIRTPDPQIRSFIQTDSEPLINLTFFRAHAEKP
jgi:hypothetical protein